MTETVLLSAGIVIVVGAALIGARRLTRLVRRRTNEAALAEIPGWEIKRLWVQIDRALGRTTTSKHEPREAS